MFPSLHATDAKVRHQASISLFQYLVCSVCISLCAVTSDTTCLSLIFFFFVMYLWSLVLPQILLSLDQTWHYRHQQPYRSLDWEGYSHQTIDTIGFMDEWIGVNIYTTKSPWYHAKAFFDLYSQKRDYIYFLAKYTFETRCKAERVDTFITLIHTVSSMNWHHTSPLQGRLEHELFSWTTVSASPSLH